jgi:hypothetical protein
MIDGRRRRCDVGSDGRDGRCAWRRIEARRVVTGGRNCFDLPSTTSRLPGVGDGRSGPVPVCWR